MGALTRAAIAAVFLFLGAALVAFWADGARAGKGDLLPVTADSPSPELMRALMAWASPRVGLPVPAAVPRVVRASHCELQAIFRPGAACAEKGSGAVALYDDGVMRLRDDWRHDSLRDVSTLLHELVHHMQWRAGASKAPCTAEAIERPAYDAQLAFLKAAGVDPMKTVGLNPLMLMLVTSCMPGS